MEVERYQGLVVKVGEVSVKTLNLPDWDLCYVQYPPSQMVEYRKALMRAHVHLVRVTDTRIYFEQG